MSFTEKKLSEIVKENMSDYAVSVATDRALVSLCSGLKPVHRRILQTMFEKGFLPGTKPVKTASISGNTMAMYHPHGSADCTGLVQPFTIRYPLIEGIGNWGSPDQPDSVAAERYTECRLHKNSMELLLKDTKYFRTVPNYDGSRQEWEDIVPVIPGCLLFGCQGMAVGVSTYFPSHRVTDICKSLLAYMQGNEYLDGFKPDLPVKCLILSSPEDVRKMYETGKGSIIYQSVTDIQEVGKTFELHIRSFPPGFSKSSFSKEWYLNLVDSGKLTLENRSNDKIDYVFISKDKSILEEIISKLKKTVSYTFNIEHHGTIHQYTLKEIYDSFLIDRENLLKRKFTSERKQESLNLEYLEALLKFKSSGVASQVLSITYEDACSLIRSRLDLKTEMVEKILSNTFKSLLIDNKTVLMKKISDSKDKISILDKNLSDIRSYIQKEVTELLNSHYLRSNTDELPRCYYKGDIRERLINRDLMTTEEYKSEKKGIKLTLEKIQKEIEMKPLKDKQAAAEGKYTLFISRESFLVTKGYRDDYFPDPIKYEFILTKEELLNIPVTVIRRSQPVEIPSGYLKNFIYTRKPKTLPKFRVDLMSFKIGDKLFRKDD